MVQGRERPCLATKASHTLTIASELGWQCLDGDVAAECGVARPVDFPHAAHAERRDDAVMAKLPTHKGSFGAACGGRVRRLSPIEKTAGVSFRRDKQFDLPSQLRILAA